MSTVLYLNDPFANVLISFFMQTTLHQEIDFFLYRKLGWCHILCTICLANKARIVCTR
jgi:hypothetical protein